jgi:hypothetical protein
MIPVGFQTRPTSLMELPDTHRCGCQTPTVGSCQTPTVGLPDAHRLARGCQVARRPPFGERLPDTHHLGLPGVARGCQTPTLSHPLAKGILIAANQSEFGLSVWDPLGVWVSGTPPLGVWVSGTPGVWVSGTPLWNPGVWVSGTPLVSSELAVNRRRASLESNAHTHPPQRSKAEKSS